MSDLLRPVTRAGSPERDKPAADKLISGNPEFTTWVVDDENGVVCGVWRSTPGKWQVAYDEWEYFRVLAGTSILTETGGHPMTLRPGDAYIVRPGFTGTWEVIVTTTKDFVVRPGEA